jgi:hypothetical protein
LTQWINKLIVLDILAASYQVNNMKNYPKLSIFSTKMSTNTIIITQQEKIVIRLKGPCGAKRSEQKKVKIQNKTDDTNDWLQQVSRDGERWV